MSRDPSAGADRADGAGRAESAARYEMLGLLAIVIGAALLRLIDLPTRGTWDADQGHDMLVLRDLVMNGQVPLLGPPTSIGNFHHGVLYYFLLAPIAALSGADPVAVTAAIAIAGTLAVVVTWWLARDVGGPVAGLVAGLLMAVSASAIEESTFIWNPNVIALSSSIALAAAWRAFTTRRARWWVVAGAASVVTMHGHVLGVILTPVVAALLVADLRRRPVAARRPVVRAGLGWLAIAALSFVPLLIHELGSGASELRGALGFLASSGSDVALPIRLPIVGLRVLSWPLTGLITAAPTLAIVAAALVVGLATWRAVAPGPTAGPGATAGGDGIGPVRQEGEERTAARWLGLGLAWTVVALAVGAGGLATVVPGLPNDHYHAFADPIVFVLVAVGIAALARNRPAGAGRLGSAAAIAIVVMLGGWNLLHQPSAVAADGGWPAGAAAGERILRTLPAGPTEIVSLPTVKSPDAVRFPLVRAGAPLPALVDPTALPAVDAVARIVLCDDLFRVAIGSACGGPAEDALAAAAGLTLIDRFEAAPGRWVSVYTPG